MEDFIKKLVALVTFWLQVFGLFLLILSRKFYHFCIKWYLAFEQEVLLEWFKKTPLEFMVALVALNYYSFFSAWSLTGLDWDTGFPIWVAFMLFLMCGSSGNK
jgi:hypothetical protein